MLCPACGFHNLPGSDSCVRCMLPLTHVDHAGPQDRVQRSLLNDPVSALGPNPPVTVAADDDLGTALRAMMDRGVGAVLVTDAAGRLVGILTERDFLTKAAGSPGFEGLRVADFMTAAPETVGPGDRLAYALSKMDAGRYRHLPVVDGGLPVGMVSVRDVLRHVTRLCGD